MMPRMMLPPKMTFLRLKNFFAWFSPVHPIRFTHFVTTICWKTIRTGIVPFAKDVTSGVPGIATNATNALTVRAYHANDVVDHLQNPVMTLQRRSFLSFNENPFKT